MKIAVIGGNGKIGSLLLKEADNRGHEVSSFVRKKLNNSYHTLVKDLFALTPNDVKDYDVVISAFGVWKPEEVSLFTDANKHLCDILSGSSTRLIVVGSAGSLYVDDERKTMFINTPEMPDFAVPVATEQEKALRHLKTRTDVQWTYLSPPVDFRVDGERTGRYKTSDDRLLLSAAGESQISYADGAIAIIDESENGNHIKSQFSIVAV